MALMGPHDYKRVRVMLSLARFFWLNYWSEGIKNFRVEPINWAVLVFFGGAVVGRLAVGVGGNSVQGVGPSTGPMRDKAILSTCSVIGATCRSIIGSLLGKESDNHICIIFSACQVPFSTWVACHFNRNANSGVVRIHFSITFFGVEWFLVFHIYIYIYIH